MIFNLENISVNTRKDDILGVEQIQALDLMKDFLKNNEKVFSLIGAAGTGKSFIMKHLIEHMDEEFFPYCLCAPTHKAKLVLSRFTNREAITLHKLLALSPNIEILDLDFYDLKFRTRNGKLEIPRGGVVICDESSMINDDMYELLLEKCKDYNCKIIFVGDQCQLRPVKGYDVSKVFNVKNRFTLTKIYRQSDENALAPILLDLRTNCIDYYETKQSPEGSLYCFTDTLQFVKSAVPSFTKAMRNGDILATKILAYTNARVQAYNSTMRRVLFEDSDRTPYHAHEFLTGYENLEFNGMKFWNSMDYIIIDPPEKKEVYIPNFMRLPGYELNLYDSAYDVACPIFILDPKISDDYTQALASTIETLRLEAINLKSNHRHQAASKKWKQYYETIGSFTTPKDLHYDNRVIRRKSFDYGYACSSHKSQGSSFGEVFVDIKNINICRDEDERRQLQYVSLSRTRKDVYLLQ